MVDGLAVAAAPLKTVSHLILKRAKFSRPFGQWQHEDYDVFADGKAIGRIYGKARLMTSPSWRWFWSILDIAPAVPHVTYGHAATLDDAKVKFRAMWPRCTWKRHIHRGPLCWLNYFTCLRRASFDRHS
jgi:hypothetical protein